MKKLKYTIELDQDDMDRLSFYCGYLMGLKYRVEDPELVEQITKMHDYLMTVRDKLLLQMGIKVEDPSPPTET